MARRAALLVVLLSLGAAAAPSAGAAAAPPPTWSPGVSAAREYLQHRRGDVAFAVRTPGRFWGHRSTRVMHSASVVKAMLMVAYLNRPSVRGRALRRGDLRLLSPMIRRSDNATASRIRDIVGNGALRALARRVGMRRFRTARRWGLSQITAADQTRFFLRVDEWVPARHRGTALRLLGSIVPSQRWGIARVRPRGWRLYFKGGWGAGRGLVEHQVALLRRGELRVSVAILSRYNGSAAYGRATMREVARRLLRGLAGPVAGDREQSTLEERDRPPLPGDTSASAARRASPAPAARSAVAAPVGADDVAGEVGVEALADEDAERALDGARIVERPREPAREERGRGRSLVLRPVGGEGGADDVAADAGGEQAALDALRAPALEKPLVLGEPGRVPRVVEVSLRRELAEHVVDRRVGDVLALQVAP